MNKQLSSGALWRMRVRVWTKLAFQRGPGFLLRAAKRSVEEALVARGHSTLLLALRLWHAGLIALGAWLCTLAPRLRVNGVGGPEVIPLLEFIAVTGVGSAIALRSLVQFACSFSISLMAAGAQSSLRPALLRGLAVLIIAAAAASYPWPLSGWVATATAGIVWMVWPLVRNLAIAAQIGGFSRARSPIAQMLAEHDRKLSPEQRRLLAVHEAGHAVFFGLGSTYPEDLFAWIDESVPSPDDIVRQGTTTVVGGAVTAFNDLGRLWLAPQVGRPELLFTMGMLMGGTAAENVVYGKGSLSHLMDAAQFEQRARVYLTLYPEFPFFAEPATDAETRTNAASIAALRERIAQSAEAFLHQNRGVLDEIAAALQAHGELAVDALAPLLAKVQPAGGFEKIRWPDAVAVFQGDYNGVGEPA